MQAIHVAGITHNDFLPQNIVLSSTGAVQLIDFSHSDIHVCPGDTRCPELQQVRRVLEV
jgi:tRNA A-37 threonylcarbamoyl transferase component Bud32